MKITRTELRRIIMKEARLNEEVSKRAKLAVAAAPTLVLGPGAASALAAALVTRQSMDKVAAETRESWENLDPKTKSAVQTFADAASDLKDAAKDAALDGLITMLQGLKSDEDA